MGKYNFTLIIPSLDPDEKLSQTVFACIAAGIDDIILVDDGSSKDNRHFFTELETALPQVTLLTHEKNLGKGAALKTAFTYFLKEGAGGYSALPYQFPCTAQMGVFRGAAVRRWFS